MNHRRRAAMTAVAWLVLWVPVACSSDKRISASTESAAVATADSVALATTIGGAEPPQDSSASTTMPATTGAPAPTPTTVRDMDPRLEVEPLDGVAAECSEAGCPSVAVTIGGEIVVFDSSTFTLTFTGSGRTLAVDPVFGDQLFLVAIGPDDVAYFEFAPPDAVDPIGVLVAVATSGASAGTEVARSPEVLDMTGDSTIVATSAGLVSVGCCGHGERQPPVDAALLLPWVAPNGDPSGVMVPEVYLEYPTPGDMVVVRSDGATELRWTLAGVQSGRDMPEVVATDDGGALLWLYDGLAAPDVPAVLYELRPDGTSDALAVGGYTDAAAMHSSRFVVVFDDDGYAVLRLS